MTRKEQLEAELEEIREKEFLEAVEKSYPEYKKMEGKCFKQTNSYSCPETENDYWPIYTKIIKIEKEDLYPGAYEILSKFTGIRFQLDITGIVSIDTEFEGYTHSFKPEEEITEPEFIFEWGKILDKLNKLL
jgi:hypothetical protein